MAWSLVKECAAAFSVTVSPGTLVFKGGNQPGTLIVVGISAFTNAVLAVSDTAGNIYTQAAAFPNAGGTQRIFYAISIGSNVDNVVSVLGTLGGSRIEGFGCEYSGNATGSVVSASGSQYNAGAAALSYTINNNAGELIVTMNGRSGGGGSWTNISPGQERDGQGTPHEYNDVINSGNITTVTATGPGAGVAGLSVSFKPLISPGQVYQTGTDVIQSGARLAGLVGDGDTLQGNQPGNCFIVLQQMLDEWQADRLKVFQILISTFPLTVGNQTYQLGAGVAAPGFNMPRPARIDAIGIQMLANPAQPAEIPCAVLDSAEWAMIPVKNIQGGYPRNCYPDYAFPIMNLNFWTIPSLACNVVLYTWNPLQSWTHLTQPIAFPPAYAKAIRYNLAVELCAEFKLPIDPIVAAKAEESKGFIETLNLPKPILGCDPGIVGKGAYYDWRSDTFVQRR